MPSRARDRQLAKLHARRQAERRAARRRRNLIYGGIAAVIAIVALIVAWTIAFGGGDESTAASGTPSASSTPSGKPGTQTGTVDPTPAPAEVACGGSVPKTAGQPKPQFAGPPPMKIDPAKTYTATFETSCGTIVVELDPKTAPQTVNSFVFLADKGFFDGQYVTRLDTSLDVIQAGDPTETGSGGHRPERQGAGREPRVHDLRDDRRRSRRRAEDPAAAGRGSVRGDHGPAADPGDLLRLGDGREELAADGSSSLSAASQPSIAARMSVLRSSSAKLARTPVRAISARSSSV